MIDVSATVPHAHTRMGEDGELAHAETSEALDDVLKALGEQISDQPVARAS